MRVSCDPNDPAYALDCWRYKAYLNGVKVQDCIIAGVFGVLRWFFSNLVIA